MPQPLAHKTRLLNNISFSFKRIEMRLKLQPLCCRHIWRMRTNKKNFSRSINFWLDTLLEVISMLASDKANYKATFGMAATSQRSLHS